MATTKAVLPTMGTDCDDADCVDLAEQLRMSEERHRLVAENANDVVWLYDIADERQVEAMFAA